LGTKKQLAEDLSSSSSDDVYITNSRLLEEQYSLPLNILHEELEYGDNQRKNEGGKKMPPSKISSKGAYS